MKLHELIDTSQHAAAVTALTAAQHADAQERDPIILKILTGLSAWVASLFLLGFVVVGLQAEETAILFLGILLAALAIFAHHRAPHAGVFVAQSTLASMMCGHILILTGVLMNFHDSGGDEVLTLAITQTLLCPLPLFAFRRSAYRASALLLTGAFWTTYAVASDLPWLFRTVLAVQVAAFGALVLWHSRRSSLAHALAFSIGAMIFFLDWIHSLAYLGSFDEPLWPTNLIMTVLLLAIAGRFTSNDSRCSPQILLLFALSLAPAFLSSPGLLFAIALLILGYGLREPVLGGLGLIGLPLFLIYFYYSLEVTLLQKSGILLASGIICLLVALLAKYHTKPKEPICNGH